MFQNPKTLTFAITTAVSGNLQLDDTLAREAFVTLYAVRTTGAWTSASLGVQGSADGTNFYPITYEDGSYAGGTPSASDFLTFVIPAFPYIRLWSHNSGTSENQAAAESFSVMIFAGQRVAERTFAQSGLTSGAFKHDVEVAAADGAITSVSGVVHITKATAAALTLADPTNVTDDGKVLVINSTTAAAHTVDNSAGSGFNGAGAGSDIGTYGGAIGDGFIVYAYGGEWWVINNLNVTLA